MILITGGAGYIGSHTCVELLKAGHEVVVVDNLSNSRIEALHRVERIAGKTVSYVIANLNDRNALRQLFSSYRIEAVIHFAGLKAVGESVIKPLQYYFNNVSGSIALFETMAEFGVKRLVFSSSATVYGDPHAVPIHEDFPLVATNPYGRSKLMVEDILRDLAQSDSSWRIALLRYFNPVGAHESGLIGEDPSGIPNNLMPFVSQVAIGRREELMVFGNDYPTHDGTGVRDYIHVLDLAVGHLAALEALDKQKATLTVNLGTGRGYSVLDVIHAFEKASDRAVPFRITERRPGDIAACYADSARAFELMGWQAVRDLETMCRDAWNWQSRNPRGYIGK
ncbi:UDP-glucose 4-epimerase GalE [Sideroxydans sp. CL21]|uniref:UDP-glucose 4-epimerase GalE n=1 Tax=Sideroxydans sp. CL21 TaxID=2600596 RepID=UPI0024BD2EBE|nr:UDP-glucose 4-epimerase GalE [Sideroxydans sp. CL21]